MIGRGWHRRAGSDHAEVRAISGVRGSARGATLYVTMEPCCTFGKTPPCTEAILRAGIERVVIGARDPNPAHRGRGEAILRRHGIDVTVGVLGEEASLMIEDFAKFIATGLPFTVVKAAMTLDGKIAAAGGDSRWVTGPEARNRAHLLRWRSDAVVVGRGTAARDDPLLSARPRGLRPRYPLRVVLDSHARLSPALRIFARPHARKTLVAVTSAAPPERVARIEKTGARVVRCISRRGRVSVRDLWRRLGRMGVMSLLVEGGGEMIASVMDARLADRIAFFIAPKIIGGRRAPTAVEGEGIKRMSGAIRVERMSVRRLGADLLVEGYPVLG